MTYQKKIFILLSLIGFILLLLLCQIVGYSHILKNIAVSPGQTYFGDLRVYMVANKSWEKGIDPLIRNIGDKNSTRLNAMLPLRHLNKLGIDESDTIWIGCLLIFLFYVGICLSPIDNNFTTISLLLGLFSPISLLAIERANTDLLIFFIISLASYNIRNSSIISFFLIFISFILKLFPIAALTIFLFQNKKDLTKFILGILIAILVAFFLYDDIKLIKIATPQPKFSQNGFGLKMLLRQFLDSKNIVLSMITSITVAASFYYCRLSFKKLKNISFFTSNDASSNFFIVGSSIYCCCYLFNSNFNYRLIFLLFCFSYLSSNSNSKTILIKTISRISISFIFFLMYNCFFMRYLPKASLYLGVIDIIVEWSLFLIFTTILFHKFTSCYAFTQKQSNMIPSKESPC